MKLNRKWIMVLAVVMSMAMATTGTLAYLTDEDADVNTMVLGKVKIEQIELERKDPSESAADNKDNFQEYTQGQMLLPAVGTDEYGNIPYATDEKGNAVLQQLPYGGAMQLFDDSGKNVMDKLVFVKNKGNSNAYVRTLIAYEGTSVGGDTDSLIHPVYNGNFWTENVIGTIEVDGVTYSVYEYIYKRDDGAGIGVLKAGETTRPSLLQLYMASWADNEDLEQFGDSYEILVLSQAVQADGFDDAATALNTAFGAAKDLNKEDSTKTNAQVWFEKVYSEGGLPTTVVATADELEAALAAGGNVMLTADITVDETITVPAGVKVNLNLAGNTISGGYQENSDTKHIYPISNYGDLTISGGTITGRGVYNQDGATITVNGATLINEDTNGGACVWSYGTGEVYLNDATLIGYTGCVSSEGYVEINGGTYTCYSGIDDDGTQLSAPTYSIRAYNGLKITDGTFTSRHGVISVGGGECVIEDGTYTIEFASATTSNVVYAYGNADVTINNGSFLSDNTSNTADSGAAVLVYGSDAQMTINDGTYVGMNGMVSGNANTKLYGGTYNTVWDYNHYGNLSAFVAEGYAATQNADGSWTVAAE